MMKLPLVAEIAGGATREEAQRLLDDFREAVQPGLNYGITLYQTDDARPFSESTPEHSANFTRILNELLTDDAHGVVFEESIEGYAAAAAAASLLADWEQSNDGTDYFTAKVKRGDVLSVIEVLHRWAQTLTDTPAKEKA